MHLTQEQVRIGKDNFREAMGYSESRREFLKAAAAAGTGLGAMYFGYKSLNGSKPVRVGFIGTGDEGNVLITQHPPEYMDIVAIADLRPSAREKTIHGHGNEARIGLIEKLGREKALSIELFENHEDLLAAKARLELEAVVISVPLSQHARIALEAMDAGLHVLSEKLMAQNITDCKKMIHKARDKKLLLAVGHQRHYSVLYDNANQIVQGDLLGDIKYIRAEWHRNNSFPKSDSWRKDLGGDKADFESDSQAIEKIIEKYGYKSMQHLVNWRLYNETGGGLMAELGSHQMDACSIFLGKKHPLAVQGFGGKIYYGVPHVGTEDKQNDPREIDDHIFVTLEFPGRHYDPNSNPNDLCVVTYSSINTNRLEPYGETLFGSRGTLIVNSEKEALLYKEAGPSSPGGIEQRLWVIDRQGGGGPALDAYESTGPSGKAQSTGSEEVSRGYTEEMEHFCYCVREKNFDPPDKGGLRCPGTVAMGDAIMAITANLAMKHKKRIVFKHEWFDPDNDAVPENDRAILA